jgi:aldehyde dehydrogenase (NAD+)
MQTITKHYIDGAFVESHGSEVMDIIKPTDGQAIARYGIEAFLEPQAILE